MNIAKECLLVGAGGMVGSICRYLVSVLVVSMNAGHHIPYATFSVNAAGSLLIGMIMASVAGTSGWHFLAVVGFCGGFTTFSTFSAELLGMFRSGNHTMAILYMAASLATCVVAVWLGMILGGKFINKPI